MAQSTVIEADLPQPLSADHLETGSAFVLKLVSPWERENCRLPQGTLLHAVVRKATRDAHGHTSELTFTLTAPCAAEGPLDLVVVSLLAPPVVEASNQPIPSFFGGLAGKAGAPPPISHAFTDAAVTSSETRGDLPVVVHVNKLPKSIAAGQVYHLPHVSLSVPEGGSTESTIATSSSSLHLPTYTILILRPVMSGDGQSNPVALVAARTPPEARHVIAAFIGACRRGHCSSYSPAFSPTVFGATPLRAPQDLRPLGFRPDHDRDVAQLGLSTTVHFLSDTELLITFPTHDLVRRDGTQHPADDPRSVRAVLLNVSTGYVEHVEDWVVDDHESFIWPVGENLLVHQGHSLLLYGPGLKEIASLALDLPLAAIRPSPDGHQLLLGEVHELHTMEDHRLVRQNNTRPLEEEIFWSLLDAHLNRVRSLGATSSYVPPPTLLNSGLVELRRGHNPEWLLAARGWDSGTEKLLGSLHSSCLPTLGNVPPDLLTVTVCASSDSSPHTYLLHENGTPVVEQSTTSQELPLNFSAASTVPKVALLITHADERYVRGLAFNQSALRTQVVKVLDTSDGTLQASVPFPDVSPDQDAVALSPNGNVLALLSGHDLLLYALRP